MGPLRATCVPIFMAHRFKTSDSDVNGHCPKALRRYLTFLRARKYQIISLRDLVDAITHDTSIPKNAVVFTMDDGFADQAEIGLPVFKSFDIPVSVFLATGLVDGHNWSWDYKLEHILLNTRSRILHQSVHGQSVTLHLESVQQRLFACETLIDYFKTLPDEMAQTLTSTIAEDLQVDLPLQPPSNYEPMSWSQIRKLADEGVDFGPHTLSHSILARLPESKIAEEIELSRRRLQDELTDPLNVFCYPSGREGLDFGDREKQVVKSLGFDAAVSADPGYVLTGRDRNDMLALPRFSLPDNNLSEFIQYCSWIERFKEIVRGRN